jgi:uncharacterized membrane protein
MDCYFHSNVPSIALCTHCNKSICATCRDERGECPSCRLAERIDTRGGRLPGDVGPRGPQSEPFQPQVRQSAAVTTAPSETRVLAALGYPFWPLAVLALFDPKRDGYIRRQAWQALGFNFGMAAVGFFLHAVAAIPFLGWSAWPLIPFLLPIMIVADVVYAIKVWHGEDVRIPLISDWVDARVPQ